MTFLQLHTLTSYPAALLNRDDVGFAKRLPFGGASRLRISSQCLKRHWRTFDGDYAISGAGGHSPSNMSIRSRMTFERHIRDPLIGEGFDSDLAGDVTGLMMIVATQSGDAKKLTGKWNELKKARTGKEPRSAEVRTDQPTVFGAAELGYLLQEARALAASCSAPEDVWKVGEDFLKAKAYAARRDNLKVLAHAAGLDGALFGRMVTSDLFARGDAAVHVAHSFTVHSEDSESDYFSVIDDIAKGAGEAGSGHINSTELTSGLYYGYVVVDVPLLVSNLEGGDRREWTGKDRTLAAEVVRRLVHLVSKVSPGAKLGSTAPYAYSHLVLAEWGTAQPRTLANAFDRPVVAHGDLLHATYDQLGEYVSEVDAMYGRATDRRLSCVRANEGLLRAGADKVPLDQLAEFCASRVRG